MQSRTASRVLVVKANGLDLCLAPELAERRVDLAGRHTTDPLPQVRGLGGFRLTHANHHDEACCLVNQAAAAGDPFELAFVGLPDASDDQGLGTLRRLCELDLEMQIVLVAPPGCPRWREVLRSLGNPDRLIVLRTPFEAGEARQLALSLTRKWKLARQANLRFAEVMSLAERANQELHEEIRKRAEVEEELRHLAYHDQVTGLPNRAMLLERVERCIQRSQRIPSYRFAVLYLDLDNFKLINDTMGHEQGDILLREVAQRLQQGMRSIDAITRAEEDVAARVGGDEFIVLLEGLRDLQDSARVARRFLEILGQPFRLQGREVTVCASIGIATSERTYTRAGEVLRDADTAMYRAKQGGKGRYAIFDPEMHAAAKRRLEIESKLRDAILRERFQIAFQPLVDVRSGELVSFEALFRCHLPGVDAGPREIINIAEESRLIVPLGRWVFRRACAHFADWLRRFPAARNLKIAINLSRRELNDEELIGAVRETLSETGLPPAQVCIEITESGIIEHGEMARARLRELRDLGVQLHMDDFGTGYSSLACLHTFPLDAVKIDRAFTATMTNDTRCVAVVKAIVTLCRALGMRVTVEGIETPEQLELVTSLGCDSAQGYLFAKPMPPEAVEGLLEQLPNLNLAA